MCDLETYECSDLGLFFPITNEYTWAKSFRIIVYLVGLLWSFMGVSIIADMFMEAIETITSKKQKLKLVDPSSETGFQEIEVLAWNGTVANLTLMALGSSAPEILLSVIEILKESFMAGPLGPGTIVGSAAFNLMCITGICVISVPKGEVRKIDLIKVFAITCIFSIWAYIWLIIILIVITPDYVDMWEAFVTLLFFPIMVLLAYLADKNFFMKETKVKSGDEEHLDLDIAGQQSYASLRQDVKSWAVFYDRNACFKRFQIMFSNERKLKAQNYSLT